ncbi:hypothetical protein KW842_24510, partial [Duganella sp. sic0402]|uniref:hypothetical protein n=1 Tax=Duganella sp. sic0402 TaxID=2854786 RepID=UPI001C45BC8C
MFSMLFSDYDSTVIPVFVLQAKKCPRSKAVGAEVRPSQPVAEGDHLHPGSVLPNVHELVYVWQNSYIEHTAPSSDKVVEAARQGDADR